MRNRINIQELEPDAYRAMIALEQYVVNSAVSKTHYYLIKNRASQINGCAFCIDMHTEEAIRNGESAKRLFLLNAWRESDLFTDEEKIVLAITEEVTRIDKAGLSDRIYAQAERIFGPHYIASIIMTVVSINAWNRIAISTRKTA